MKRRQHAAKQRRPIGREEGMAGQAGREWQCLTEWLGDRGERLRSVKRVTEVETFCYDRLSAFHVLRTDRVNAP